MAPRSALLSLACVLALVCLAAAHAPSLDAPAPPSLHFMRTRRAPPATATAASAAAAPVLDDFSPTMGPPGTWVYLFGSGFVGNVSARFLPDTQLHHVAVYDEHSLGVTVPETNGTLATIEVVTDAGAGAAAAPFVVAAPVRPPVLSGFYGGSGPVGCYTYLHGDNFVLGHTTVEFGHRGQATVRVPEVHYSHDSIGITIPEQLRCVKEAWDAGVPVIVTTPHGSVQSPFTFVLQDGSSDDFCVAFGA